jgi:hypothetical protein
MDRKLVARNQGKGNESANVCASSSKLLDGWRLNDAVLYLELRSATLSKELANVSLRHDDGTSHAIPARG